MICVTEIFRDMEDPEIKEIYQYKDLTEFRLALDYPPPDGWIQSRNLGGDRESKYIPISIAEALADMMFREWYVIEEKPLAIKDGVGFTVKIQGLPDYPGADHVYFTGSGAVVFQDSGNAIEYQFPAARSKAISNAFNQLGNLFGRNLGRSVNGNPIGNGFTLRKKKEEKPE